MQAMPVALSQSALMLLLLTLNLPLLATSHTAWMLLFILPNRALGLVLMALLLLLAALPGAGARCVAVCAV